MKRLCVSLLIVLMISGLSLAQNLSGSLSGNLGPASYTVIDSIWVATGNTLNLAPGTVFNFAGAFGFGVAGTLTAVGTAADSIKFIPVTGVPFWKGIDVLQTSANTSAFTYCRLEGANSSAIFLNHAGPTISHCTFFNNSCVDFGGAIYSMYGTGSISDCYFGNNTSVNGGALVIRYTPVNVTNCIFTGSNGTYGGAIAYYFSTVCNLTNCVFYGNSGNEGGAIRFSSSPVNAINCTFSGNSGGSGGAIFNINQTSVLKNCLLWGDTGPSEILVYAGATTVTYSDVQGSLYPGVGNINTDPLFVVGPNGAYYLSQVAAGQTANSPCFNAGDPASAMITGTTRTDQVQDAGVVDMGYHYAAVAAPLNVSINLVPIVYPIIIPANGGNFSFYTFATNNGTTPAAIQLWTEWQYPNGTMSPPLLGPRSVNLPAGTMGWHRTQNVPNTAPPGNYIYFGYIGIYPSGALDTASFAFSKSTTVGNGPTVWDALCTGDPFPGEAAVSAPASFKMSGASPNPFNPTTTISFTLPEASRVTLNIYDVNGRLVTTLVNGWRDAGQHSVTFDGSNLSSGVYLYTLTAGQNRTSGKMALLK